MKKKQDCVGGNYEDSKESEENGQIGEWRNSNDETASGINEDKTGCSAGNSEEEGEKEQEQEEEEEEEEIMTTQLQRNENQSNASNASGGYNNTNIVEYYVEYRKDSNIDVDSVEWKSKEKHYFVLSSAGKPIYSRYGDEAKLSSLMGAIQAIISTFGDFSDRIRSIDILSHKVVFLLIEPIYLVMVSSKGESEEQMVCELEYLYESIISILTKSQLLGIFERYCNFDLRRLLGGTEKIMDRLVDRMQDEAGYVLGTLEVEGMEYMRRDQINEIMVRNRPNGLVFGYIVRKERYVYCKSGNDTSGEGERWIKENSRIVAMIKPKKIKMYVRDIQILMNTIMNSNQSETRGDVEDDVGVNTNMGMNRSEDESNRNRDRNRDRNKNKNKNKSRKRRGEEAKWTPICFPKFNSKGFLHVYSSDLEVGKNEQKEEGEDEGGVGAGAGAGAGTGAEAEAGTGAGAEANVEVEGGELSIVLVSNNREAFYELNEYKKAIEKEMRKMEEEKKKKSRRKKEEGRDSIVDKIRNEHDVLWYVYKDKKYMQHIEVRNVYEQQQYEDRDGDKGKEVRVGGRRIVEIIKKIKEKRSKTQAVMLGMGLEGGNMVVGMYRRGSYQVYAEVRGIGGAEGMKVVRRITANLRKNLENVMIVKTATF